MHINSHYAIGITTASIFHYFFGTSFFEFIIIVMSSFIMDLDVFFVKYAKDKNHRMLITHSIIPCLSIFIIGFIFFWPALIACGFAYFTHIIVDSLDWGTNFFFFPEKMTGIKMLITKDEFENLPKHLAEYKHPQSFFDFKYYKCKVCLIIEAILFLIMILFVILLAFEYTLLVLIYFLGLFFHLKVHFNLKKLEQL